jgi:hypothetical protein
MLQLSYILHSHSSLHDNTDRKASKVTEEEAEGLLAEIFTCIGAKVMLTTSL